VLPKGNFLLNLSSPSKQKADWYRLQIIQIQIHSLFYLLKNH